MARVRISLPRPFLSGPERRRGVEVEADTVGQALQRLAETCPELKGQLFAAPGKLSPGVVVFVGQRDVRFAGGLNARLEDGQVVYVMLPTYVG